MEAIEQHLRPAQRLGPEERQRRHRRRFRLRPRRHRPRHRHRLRGRQGHRGHGPPARGGRHGAHDDVPRHRLHRGARPHRLRRVHPPQVRLIEPATRKELSRARRRDPRRVSTAASVVRAAAGNRHRVEYQGSRPTPSCPSPKEMASGVRDVHRAARADAALAVPEAEEGHGGAQRQGPGGPGRRRADPVARRPTTSPSTRPPSPPPGPRPPASSTPPAKRSRPTAPSRLPPPTPGSPSSGPPPPPSSTTPASRPSARWRRSCWKWPRRRPSGSCTGRSTGTRPGRRWRESCREGAPV